MLKGKVIIVTGGGGLLGQEFVKNISLQRGIAIIADINEEVGTKVQAQICLDQHSTLIDFVPLDITSKESIVDMINVLHKRYGRIDAIVNNAYPRNKNFGRNFFDIEYADFCENLNLHLGGYFLVSQQVALYFQKQGYGNIVNMSSIYGVIPPKFEIYKNTKMTNSIEYAAIKSAVVHITKYMTKFFKGMNIRVNSISPGGIFDNQPESFLSAYREQCANKGMLDKSDINGTLIFLLSDMSNYINGQNIIVDDGFSL